LCVDKDQFLSLIALVSHVHYIAQLLLML